MWDFHENLYKPYHWSVLAMAPESLMLLLAGLAMPSCFWL
uniref:Uncharacterized protein n=1 Tax=Rhizophora mucronata TaxID=61149 RepID=A0A2P2IZI1_RHIMU